VYLPVRVGQMATGRHLARSLPSRHDLLAGSSP